MGGASSYSGGKTICRKFLCINRLWLFVSMQNRRETNLVARSACPTRYCGDCSHGVSNTPTHSPKREIRNPKFEIRNLRPLTP
jgi:succinate dehydrogenase/fumarate reductase-like Fe-S protein